jgi:pimeloyl-ACP methyl ester carboxylesterase
VSLAHLNGIDLFYEEHWVDAPPGLPLVLVHGFGVTHRYWDATAAALGGRYRVVVFDARGHGLSGVPDDLAAYDELMFVEDLRALLDHLGIERAVIGGLSMGGNIALRFGMASPERCAGLIVGAPGTGSDDARAWRRRCEVLGRVLRERGVESFADAVLASPPVARFVSRGPEERAWLRAQLTCHRAEGLMRTVLGEQATRPSIYALEDEIRGLAVPLLVVVGEHDEASVGPSRFLAECAPRADLVVMAGAGHLTNLEQPEAFASLREGFLGRLS